MAENLIDPIIRTETNIDNKISAPDCQYCQQVQGKKARSGKPGSGFFLLGRFFVIYINGYLGIQALHRPKKANILRRLRLTCESIFVECTLCNINPYRIERRI